MKFVCISDTHNKHHSLEVPHGDVLIHSGDFTTLGQLEQVQSFVQWFSAQPHPHKILVAGNHDITLDIEDYDRYLYGRFHRHLLTIDCSPQEYAERCLQAVLSAEGVTYLRNSSVTIDGITIYGSPWTQPSSRRQHMAFQKFDLHDVWGAIPEGTDVVITHGPPLDMGDLTVKGQRIGNPELLYHIEDRIRPRVHVYGHNHEGFGINTSPLGGLLYINASTMTRDHRPLNRPVVFELFPTPAGETPQPARIVEFVPAPVLPRTDTRTRGVAYQSRHLRGQHHAEPAPAPAAADPSGKYSTTATVRPIGRAIAIDLSESLGNLPICHVRQPHMTLLFRSDGYSVEEAVVVQQFIDEYLQSTPAMERVEEGGRPQVEFTLEHWGEQSDLIHGELEDLAAAVFDKFQNWHQGGTYRPPHVQLRRRERQQNRWSRS